MMFYLLVAAATISANNYLCPRMAEPAPIDSASFDYPKIGRTVMVGTTPTLSSARFAIRLSQPHPDMPATMTALRLVRGYDCNLHRLDRQWTVRIPATESAAFLAKVEQWQSMLTPEPDPGTDGTTIEYRRFDAATQSLVRASNGPSMHGLRDVTLELLRKHLPADDVPATANWVWRLPPGRR